ncbi:MAG: 50S ribosomal protein L6 [Candidatus Sungbacteria bacterium]|uniref:Large ribosomal subunit protein uL6 n=1 Tax=Candidatus Sungiibacteriota bacterium TaxID=2750080 RepID=A0A9D6QU14_9BACT|nr:50S ribosomal protein L6 [Candidatus Sungbacteria bacterium]
MSRIGKQPISVPGGVTVTLSGDEVKMKGPKGEIVRHIRPEIKVAVKDNQILINPAQKTKKTQAFWGLTRAILAHSIEGVLKGFEKKLELEGVGYRVNLEGKNLVFALGFSHPVMFDAPDGIQFKVEKNVITVSGFSKDAVGETAAKIRSLKKPEPYKGKGIHYLGETIRRKAGKKASTGAA